MPDDRAALVGLHALVDGSWDAASSSRRESAGRLDRKCVAQGKQMAVAGHEQRIFGRGEGDEVVVPWIDRTGRGRVARTERDCRCARKPRDHMLRLVRRDVAAQLRIRERSREFSEQGSRDHELELAILPGQQEASRCAGRGEEGGDDDVRVEDGAQRSRPRPGRVLRFHSERDGLLLGKLAVLPQPLEQVQAKLAPECVLDDGAVATTRTCGPESDRAQDTLVDCQGRADFGHAGIKAS